VTGRSYTYAELDTNVYRLASGLHRLGIQKAEVVVIFCPNSIEYIFALLAIVANGATVAFVNPVYTPCTCLLNESMLSLVRPNSSDSTKRDQIIRKILTL